MKPYVIIVEFDILDGAVSKFMGLILENARLSLSEESGCHQFDVLRPSGVQNRVVLYEIYESEDAFQLHIQSPHFAQFDTASRNLVLRKQVTRFEMAGEWQKALPLRVSLEHSAN